MASQSSDDKPDNPGITEAQQNVTAEPPKQSSTPSVFVNSEPMREDQVQNAVKFLSHPKVRGSPVVYRRSFLEKKGLMKEEIDEAFRRVPDPAPSALATTANQADGQAKTTNVQALSSNQVLQPVATVPAAPVGTLARYKFHWSHAFLAVGLLAGSGCGTALLIKKVIIPKLRYWIRKVVSEDDNDVEKKTDTKPSLAEEATAAAKSAAAAASDVAKASQELLNSKTEERKYLGELTSLLNVQLQEMKSMSNSIRKLEGETRASRTSPVDYKDSRVTVTKSKQQYVNGKAEYDTHSVQLFSAPAAEEPSAVPHSKSYMEIMAMVQRGEKPPNVREIDDLPPNPNQQPSNPRLAPKAKPWELGQTQNNSTQAYPYQTSSEAFSSSTQENGLNYLNGDSSAPWWQRKTPSITEIDNEDEVKAASSLVVRQPVQRAWVPPQPPPVAMPEAAEAIRWPKPSVQKESVGNDQFVARSSSDVTDELQRVTKISEYGGALDMNNGNAAQISNGNSYLNSIEIQEEQESRVIQHSHHLTA